MSYGPVHRGLGLVVASQAATPWGLIAAAIFCVWTHMPLDDVNVDPTTKIYHGLGTGLKKILFMTFLGICELAILAWAILYQPWALVGVVGASLWDVEWALPQGHKYRGWLHAHMWPDWAQDVRGWYIWLPAIASLMAVIWM